MEYTKGEWKAVEYWDGLGKSQRYITNGGGCVAHIITREEAEANAQLIASAPNLYEVCVLAVGYASVKDIPSLEYILLKAIAKAGGK